MTRIHVELTPTGRVTDAYHIDTFTTDIQAMAYALGSEAFRRTLIADAARKTIERWLEKEPAKTMSARIQIRILEEES